MEEDPALTEIDPVDASGNPAGTNVLAPLKKLDSFFSLTLVVKL